MNVNQILAGQTFTDDMGHTHTATAIVTGVAEGRGVYIYVEGQDYPEFYLNETLMFVHPAGTEQELPAKGPKIGPLTLAEVESAQRELRLIAATGHDDGKWRYLKVITQAGHHKAREYRTEKGFLTAYIREALAGSEILIAE